MQNSPEVLLTGLAESLRDAVLPAVDDSYAQGQLAAAVELLGNIASRVEWQSAYLIETVHRSRAVLEIAVARAEPTELPESRRVLAEPLAAAGSPLLACRDAHLHALGEVTSWCARGRTEAHAQVDEALREFLAWQLHDEAARTKTGMYRNRVASAGKRRSAT